MSASMPPEQPIVRAGLASFEAAMLKFKDSIFRAGVAVRAEQGRWFKLRTRAEQRPYYSVASVATFRVATEAMVLAVGMPSSEARLCSGSGLKADLAVSTTGHMPAVVPTSALKTTMARAEALHITVCIAV